MAVGGITAGVTRVEAVTAGFAAAAGDTAAGCAAEAAGGAFGAGAVRAGGGFAGKRAAGNSLTRCGRKRSPVDR